jgi:hypothetical protein
MVRGFVLLGREPGGVGRTIRCVDRVDCAAPGRLGLRPAMTVRGMDIGCVVAVPAGMGDAGIKPTGCGDLTSGTDPAPGGV